MRHRSSGQVIILLFCVGLIQPLMVRNAEAQPAGVFRYKIVAKMPCYKTSPMQDRPPDTVVPVGTVIRLIPPAEGMGSYSHVETRRGLKCWISNDAFRLIAK